MRAATVISLLAIGLAATIATAEPARQLAERRVLRTLRLAFPGAGDDWLARAAPDATMAACSAVGNKPSKSLAEEIKRREKTRVAYPKDGKFLGDWKKGAKIAQSGYGLRFTDYPPKRENGGNCYACHQLSPEEVSFGTIGTSLKGYGVVHKFSAEAARLAYEKIYNSQAMVACSLMPRFGANGILTIEQIKDVVAYLMDPKSPVNQPAPRDTAANKPPGR